MKKAGLTLLILGLMSCAYLQALDVDKAELTTTSKTSVEFINYEGPHSKIETRNQIMAIGMFLAEEIGSGQSQATYAGKYSVIHAIEEGGIGQLSGDIFSLLPGAQVDHIQNLRLMLAGFLIVLYDYSEKDALLLAEFITVYNAVHRGDIEYFRENYRPAVSTKLSSAAVGLSTVYSEWPGNTELTIPLTEGAAEGGLGSLDTDRLTDEEVVDELKGREDRGVDVRKDVTELKEREVEEAQEELAEERRDLEETREKIEEEQQEIDAERERIDAERQQEDSAQQEPQDVDRVEERLSAEESALDEQETQLKEEEQELVEREQDLEEREQEQTERIERIQEEREDIAADERELLEQETDQVAETVALTSAEQSVEKAALFMDVREISGEYLARLVRIDAESGAILLASTLNSIRNRKVEIINNNYVMVAGSTAGQGAVRLMLLDQETLQTAGESSEDIYPRSFLVVNNGSIYAVVSASGNWAIGKFDGQLKLLRASEFSVLPDTVAVVVENIILITDSDGAIHRISTRSLEDLGTVQ